MVNICSIILDTKISILTSGIHRFLLINSLGVSILQEDKPRSFKGGYMIGTGELIVIFCVILLLFGGKKLPELARSLGKGIREFKQAMQGIDEENTGGSEKCVLIKQKCEEPLPPPNNAHSQHDD